MQLKEKGSVDMIPTLKANIFSRCGLAELEASF